VHSCAVLSCILSSVALSGLGLVCVLTPLPSLCVVVKDTCRQPYQITSEKGYGFLFSMMDLDTSHDLDSLVRLQGLLMFIDIDINIGSCLWTPMDRCDRKRGRTLHYSCRREWPVLRSHV
jgi:hypothetical protein